MLPHGTYVSGSRHIARPGRDLEIIRDAGATIVHCPLVSGRHGNAIDHFGRYREMGLRIGMGTDTSPPDMIMNLQVGMILARVMAGSATAVRSEDYYDAATIGGAIAPPRRVPMKTTPCADPRSRVGNHLAKLLDMFGKAPASPTPKRKRAMINEAKFQAKPVAAVKADHHNTIRANTFRGPITSPSQPLGISKNA